MSIFSCLPPLRNKGVIVDPEPGGWEDPKPRIKRQYIEDCGSLGECVQQQEAVQLEAGVCVVSRLSRVSLMALEPRGKG